MLGSLFAISEHIFVQKQSTAASAGDLAASRQGGEVPSKITLAHHFLESLAEPGLGRQLLHSFGPDAALRTPDPIQPDHHRRPELEAGQIPYLSLVYLMDLAHPLSLPEHIGLRFPDFRWTQSF